MHPEDWAEQPAVDPGNDFEQRCWGLLRRRYRPEDLIYIPATMGGDCGIEGFSLDGIAYQCYADRGSLTLRNRTDKQKKKLYDDTSKLKKYADRLDGVLGGCTIKNYFLLVPEFHAAELVAYGNERAKVVKGYDLTFISPDFRVHIKTPHDYPAELQAAFRDGAAKTSLPEPVVDDDHVRLFARETPELVSQIDEKLAALKDPAAAWNLREEFVRAFLKKEQLMKSLEAWPDTWEALEEQRLLYQEQLLFENEISPAEPRVRLHDLVQRYKAGLRSSVAGLHDADALRITYGQIGEWLMRCPLRLRAVDQ